ncbi:MAG: HTH domain-containing protein [Terrisporobacter sp.]|uniref:helix-turn-helix transcriptional regulator n=1 Tax=Terrisporobacter sp. TaxID=1965305 RepID=UPI002FCC4830
MISSKEKLTPIDRRMKIIKFIYDKRIVTMDELAEELGVAIRTIKRDIDHLSLSYPLETIRGRYGGGVKIIDNFNLRNKHLDTEEIELLEELKGCLSSRKAVIVENILTKFALCR